MGLFSTVYVVRECELCKKRERADVQFKTGEERGSLPTAEDGGVIDYPDMCPPGQYEGLAARLCVACEPRWPLSAHIVYHGYDALAHWIVTVEAEHRVTAEPGRLHPPTYAILESAEFKDLYKAYGQPLSERVFRPSPLLEHLRKRKEPPICAPECDRAHVDEIECTCGDDAASRGGDHYDSCPLSPAGIDKLIRDAR